MHTRRSTLHMALVAMMLAGSVSAQTGGGDGTTDPSGAQGTPAEEGSSTDPGVTPGDAGTRPEDTGSGVDGTMRDAPTGTTGIETDERSQPESTPRKKRRWWRRDGPLTEEERRERDMRRGEKTGAAPDAGGESNR